MTNSKRDGLVVVCTYRVRAGTGPDFERHTPTLRALGLITATPVHVLRGVEGEGPMYVEVFEWSNSDAATRASQVPEVIAIWEPMAALCESRHGLPGLEFPQFDRIGPHA